MWAQVRVFGYPSKNPYPFERVWVFARCGCGYDLWYPRVYPCRSLGKTNFADHSVLTIPRVYLYAY